jgi:hypothetical protein
MPVILIVLGAIVLAAGVLWLISRDARRREASAVQQTTTPVETLRYHVVEGQDPAAVLSELSHLGLRATVVEEKAERIVVVECPRGRVHERGDVRESISRAGTAIQDPARPVPAIRFEDEVGTA